MLAMSWVDTDQEIVKKHGEIKDIFARFGQARFREIERETLQSILSQKGAVISAGGGLVLQKANLDLLHGRAKIVFLQAKATTLEKRLRNDTARPLLQGETPLLDKIQALLNERTPIYQSVADFTVCVDDKTVDEIVKEIVEKITEK